MHIIEPFYAATIDKEATHSKLKVFYHCLYRDLGKVATSEFFSLDNPVLESVSAERFAGVIASYGPVVVTAIRDAAAEQMDDCVALLNLMLPDLRTVLARQRRDYGLSEEFPAEFPVEEQAANVDQSPCNNIAMERTFGMADYRLQKLRNLSAVSRSMILARGADLRGDKESNFRGFKEEVVKKRELELKWQKRTQEKFAEGASARQQVAQVKERKRLNMLDTLKKEGGPFTTAEQVQQYLDQEDVQEKVKQQRMKKEIQFARESSTTLPSVDPLFKIQVTLPNRRRREKTAVEFGESLMAFLGKKMEDNSLEYSTFQASLRKYSNADAGDDNNN